MGLYQSESDKKKGSESLESDKNKIHIPIGKETTLTQSKDFFFDVCYNGI